MASRCSGPAFFTYTSDREPVNVMNDMMSMHGTFMFANRVTKVPMKSSFFSFYIL